MNSISLQFAEFRGDPGELSARLDRMIAAAPQEPLPGNPAALVVPHAGYVYSGPVAAYAYRAVKGKAYDTVVIVGPSHRASFQGISVADISRIDTPLGGIPVDTGLVKTLLAAHQEITYLPAAHAQEHSVEIQLPFLQRSLGPFSVVMAVMGGWSHGAEEAFIGTLAKAAGEKRILLVASSDLSHYHDYATAKRLDAAAVDLVMRLQRRELLEAEASGTCELCGILPVHLAMGFAERTGNRSVRLLHAASSGDTAGPKDQVVGYASLAFLPGGEKGAAATPGALGPADRKRLLELARRTITGFVRQGRPPEEEVKDPQLQTASGAFVTITRHGQLRGCIGTFVSRDPLWKTVQRMSLAACSQDPRFTPMTAAELDSFHLEISVLSPMRRIADVSEIEVGRHGLYLVKGHRSGTLLPQVATDNGWDRLTFLEQTCRKAGLPPGSWKEGAEIYVYEAEVFEEE